MESSQKYLSSEQLLKELHEVAWDDIIKKLKAYSIVKIKKYNNDNSDELVQTAMDIANEAITSLWSEERKWNTNYYPDVFSFLKGAVDSLVSSYYKKLSKNKKVEINENIIDDKSSFESNYIATDLKSVINKSFDDDALAGLVFDSIAQGYKPKEISEDLGVEIKEIYNAVKRVNRKMVEIQKSLSKTT